MVGEAAKKKLYHAAKQGDVFRLRELIQEDPYLVDEVSFARSRNILHIAAMWGKFEIAEEVLRVNAELARGVDSRKSSPLHIAVAQGNLEIAKILISIALETCWWRDCHDMNPVHIAAMNGHVHILEELLQWNLHPAAMERLHRGQTVMHLCVKHDQLRALKILVEELGELVCAKDDDGETILHLAVRCHQVGIIHYLVESYKIQKLQTNSMGKTALDILKEYPPQARNYSEMESILILLPNQSMLEALPKLTDTTMVVVVLIAAMAFQAAGNPPGGVWQDDTSSHRAGDSVMASTHPKIYKHFIHANTTAFVSSLVTIFLVSTRLPTGRVYLQLIAMFTSWVSLAAIAVSYGVSIMVTTPNTETQSLLPTIIIVVAVSLCIMGFILVCNSIRQLHLSWKSKQRRQLEDLGSDSLIRRVFYRIFQRLEMNNYIDDFVAICFSHMGPIVALGGERRMRCSAPKKMFYIMAAYIFLSIMFMYTYTRTPL